MIPVWEKGTKTDNQDMIPIGEKHTVRQSQNQIQNQTQNQIQNQIKSQIQNQTHLVYWKFFLISVGQRRGIIGSLEFPFPPCIQFDIFKISDFSDTKIFYKLGIREERKEKKPILRILMKSPLLE